MSDIWFSLAAGVQARKGPAQDLGGRPDQHCILSGLAPRAKARSWNTVARVGGVSGAAVVFGLGFGGR
ncbi:hypothetical protein, partial [Luteimonas sp. MC1895]|uniref:hypothetical protein n=1 Tax=Luteimonas sp. MC1895 TaxID=2819513 RepID=UPI001A9BB1AD